MKNLKKLVALIVTIAMFATIAISAFAAVPADVKGTDYEGAVTRLQALGVITGYPDGNFGPNDSITRAQAAAVVVRALGYESIAESAKGVTKFSDVAANYWGAGYINLAVSLKLVNGYGNGKFGPEDKVTFDQMVTMIVRALGAQAFAEAKGGFPTGYLLEAKLLKFTDGVKGIAGTNATRGIVAQLIDNAKEITFFEQTGFGDSQTYVQPKEAADQRNFLKELKMTKVAGVVVTKTPATSGVGDNKFNVAGVADAYEAVAGAFDIESVLGKKVDLWKNSDGKVVLAQVAAGTDVVVKSISSITVADGVYTKIKVKDTADVETEFTIPAGTGATDNLKADTAQELLAKINAVSSSTDKFDLTLSVDGSTLLFAKGLLFDKPIQISAPVVNTVNKSIKINGYAIKLGDKNAKKLVIMKDGAAVDYTELKADDVIMVAKNTVAGATDASGDYFYILATNKTVTGTVASAKPSQGAATSIKIGTTSYDINQWDVTKDVAANLGADTKVTLDPNGKVFGLGSTAVAAATKYGVVLATDMTESLITDTVYKAKILTASGDKVVYNVVADSLKAAIQAEGDHNITTGLLIKYTLNADGNMDTAVIAGGAVGALTTLDVTKGKYGVKYVTSDAVVFARAVDGTYSVIKWADIDQAYAVSAQFTAEADLEYTALVLNAPHMKTSTSNFAYATDKTAIKDGKYIIDMVNKSGAASLTTSNGVYANAHKVFVYSVGSDNVITIAPADADIAGTAAAAITDITTARIKVDGLGYYYFTDDTIIVYDLDSEGTVEKLTKADLYKDMIVKVYTTAVGGNDIAVLVITKM